MKNLKINRLILLDYHQHEFSQTFFSQNPLILMTDNLTSEGVKTTDKMSITYREDQM